MRDLDETRAARSLRRWRLAALIMLSGTMLSYAVLLPPVLGDLPPSAYYRLALGITPRSYAIPPSADTDRDGLPDAAEFALGTNPRLPDSDGDGLGDYEEARKYRTGAAN